MLYPTINQLTKGKFNRYELVVATAKCARMITDEYTRQREAAEKATAGVKDADRAIANMIDKEYRDEKAVQVAINHIYGGDYVICHTSDEVEDAEYESAVAAAASEDDDAEEAYGDPDAEDVMIDGKPVVPKEPQVEETAPTA